MLPKGTTFIRSGHIWFNITEPTNADPFVLCVNLTTMDEDCVDDECLINPSEYKWVESDHPTVIAFSRARLWDANKILLALKAGALRKPRQGDIPKPTVAKVIKIAAKSRELGSDFKSIL